MTHEEFTKRYRYSIESDRLGEGGFGEVFKAYDSFIDKWVAIKISKVKNDLQEIRLRNEVALINKLPPHPGIARYEECYTFTSIAGEFDFGILQYYEEGNLLQLMHKHSLNADQKFLLLKDLLEGIEFLHNNNIIHRDLKPQNVLIVKRGDYFVPKITDFGISKKLNSQSSSEYSNSLAGAGTLAYASPEQLAGKTIRKNCDLWAFGVIAYQVLLGQLPFTCGTYGTTSEAGRQEMLRQINQGITPELLSQISNPWQNIISQCLEISPEKRMKSASDCMEILEGKSRRKNTVQEKQSKNSFSMEEGTTEIISDTNPSGFLSNYGAFFKKLIIGVAFLSIILVIGLKVIPILKTKNSVKENLANTKNFEKEVPKQEVSISNLTNDDSVLVAQRNDKKIIDKPEDKVVNEVAPIKTSNEVLSKETKLTFDNGNYYIGTLKAGRMHGKGTFYFVVEDLISKNDPLERRARSGCYIEGEWFDGDLYKGKLYDKNGKLKDRFTLGHN
jgi:serine/threonine protein kinase